MNNIQKSYAVYDNFLELIISINRSVKENADEIYRQSKCWCKKQVNNIKELLQ